MIQKQENEYKQWIQTIKAGDEVCIPCRTLSAFSEFRLLLVERLTKTQIICRDKNNPQSEQRFRRDDGRIIGVRDNYTTRLEECTAEVSEEMYRGKLAMEVGIFIDKIDRERHKLSINELEQVYKILSPVYNRLVTTGAKYE